MVFMPPRHFKSEIVSRLFSAYFLYRHADRWIGLCSYAAGLSYTLSRNARDNYLKAGGTLKDDAGAVSHWETGKDGGLWAAGVGGAATGKGFHLGIIDDPIKNSEEAQSLVIQERNKDWYDSTFSTRQEPDAAIVIIQTRWSLHDTAGYLLEKEKEEPENWHILHFEAIKSETQPIYPVTCQLEPDRRESGEALNSERYPIDKLYKIRGRIGNYFFNALYQQSPTLRTGRVYYAFTDANIGPASYDLDYSKVEAYYHSHDFGAVNHVWGLWAKIGNQYFLIHEEKLPEGTTEARANRIKAVWRKTVQYLVAAITQEQPNLTLEQAVKLALSKVIAGYGGAGSEEQYRRDFAHYGVTIRQPITKIGRQGSGDDAIVETQIRQANQMFESKTAMVCNDMVNTLYQLENCIRDEKEAIADKAIWHFLDSVRYFAAGVKRRVFVG